MANAFSTPASYGQWIDPINTNLVNTVLGAKQKTYDYNVAKVDGLIQEYTNLPLLREKDKAHLKDRIDTVLNVVNGVNKLDLSDGNLTRQIEQTISTAIDPETLKQIGNSQKILNFEQSVAQKREKKPELYSDINYTYAKKMAGVDSYMQETADDIGSLQYVDYKDVNKKINDFILDLSGKDKDSVTKIPEYDRAGNPTGYMIEKTIRGLTADEIRSAAESQLDSSYNQQIRINGWYNAGGYENKSGINASLDKMLNSSLGNIDSQVLRLKRDKDNGVASPDVDSMISKLQNDKTNIQKNISTYKNNPEEAATFIERERLLSNTVDAFSGLHSEDVSYSANEAYYKQKNLELDVAKLKLQAEKDLNKTTGIGEAYTTTLPTETPDNIESYQSSIDSQINETSATTKKIRDSYLSALQTEADKGNVEASNFLKEYQALKTNNKEGLSSDLVFDNLIASTTYKDKLNILGDVNFRYDLKEAKDKETILVKGLQEARSKGEASHIDATINSQAGLKAFFDNPNTKMLWYKDGKLAPASVRDVLKSKDIIDDKGNKIGDIKQHKDVLDALRRSYYADAAITNSEASGTFRKESYNHLKNLAVSLGENPSNVIKEEQYDLGNRGFSTVYGLDRNSKTWNFITNARQNGIYDTFDFSDQSLSSDDYTIGGFLRGDYKDTEVYKNEIKKYYNNLPSVKQLSVPATDKANFEKLRGYMTITNADVKKDLPITISKQGENVILTQAHSEGSGEKKNSSPINITLTQQEFNSNFGALGNKLNFNNEASFYTTDKMLGKKLISEPIKYFTEKDYKATSYIMNKVFSNDDSRKQFGGYLTESKSYENLFKSHQMLSNKYPNGKFESFLKKALSKDVSNKFSVNLLVDRDYSGEPILQVNLVSTSGENIHSQIIRGNDNITNFKAVLDVAPQAYYGMLLDDILTEEDNLRASGSQSISDSMTKLNKYIPN